MGSDMCALGNRLDMAAGLLTLGMDAVAVAEMLECASDIRSVFICSREVGEEN